MAALLEAVAYQALGWVLLALVPYAVEGEIRSTAPQ